MKSYVGKSITLLKKQAWKCFSAYVRQRDKGVCYSCGIKKFWKKQHAGHFVHRDCLDFNKKNIHCQCAFCNTFKHGNAIPYAIHLEKDYGFGIVQELKHLGDRNRSYKRKELIAIIEKYKKFVSF